MTTPSIKEALERLIADIEDYERVNNLAPSPGKKDCWQSVTNAKAALATFQPDGERREAIAREPAAWRFRYEMKEGAWGKWTVQKNKPNWFSPDQADVEVEPLYTASGLVQNEAGIRADEREKCAKIADREAEFWPASFASSARNAAANIRSARDGGAET